METASLADRIVQHMVDDRPALERLMEQESSRALHEEFLLAESGTLPDREARMQRRRAVGARAWLRHLAAALRAEWQGGPPDMQSRLERHVQTASERLEALELEEEAALEREGYAGDHDADSRRIQLGAYMRLFAEGVGDIAQPGGESGPEFGRRVTAVLRRENGRRRSIEKQAFEAWSGSPMEGVLEQARTTAAPVEPDIIRMLEAAGVWSYVRILADALGEVLEGAPQPATGE